MRRATRSFVSAIWQDVCVIALDLVVRFAPTRIIARTLVADRLATIQAAAFDSPLYLHQIASARRRRWARLDPLLHYALIGWRESRAPTPRFDPVFYRERNNDYIGDPFLHFLATCDHAHTPQNEIEALARRPGREGSTRRILVFHHARGGGSTKFLTIFENDLIENGFEPVRLRKVVHSDRLVVLDRNGRQEMHDVVDGLSRLLAALAPMSIERILVSHVVDFDPARIFASLLKFSAALQCPLDVILHDYFCICPRINLVDYRSRPCLPVPAPDVCRRCIKGSASDIGSVDPEAWRHVFADLLMQADRVLTPSEDLRQRLAAHLPRAMDVWRPEPEEAWPIRVPKIRERDLLRVVVVGGLNVAKGSRVVAELGAAIQAERAPVVISLIGESPDAALLRSAGVVVHGRYRDADLGRLIASHAPHVGFVPAIWPETWSFVLTQLLRRGLPTFAFDIGAQAERLRRSGLDDLLLAPDLIDRPDLLLQRLLTYRDDCLLPSA